MTIKILSIKTSKDYDGPDITRHANIIISDNVTHYALGVGDLPLTGDLQPILDAREAELWQAAVGKDNQLTTEQVRALIYESPVAGGWSNQEFQEAYFEERKGNITKANALDVRRTAIHAEWPI